MDLSGVFAVVFLLAVNLSIIFQYGSNERDCALLALLFAFVALVHNPFKNKFFSFCQSMIALDSFACTISAVIIAVR